MRNSRSRKREEKRKRKRKEEMDREREMKTTTRIPVANHNRWCVTVDKVTAVRMQWHMTFRLHFRCLDSLVTASLQ